MLSNIIQSIYLINFSPIQSSSDEQQVPVNIFDLSQHGRPRRSHTKHEEEEDDVSQVKINLLINKFTLINY